MQAQCGFRWCGRTDQPLVTECGVSTQQALFRAGITLVTGVVAAVVAAVTVAGVDMYMVGHGRSSILRAAVNLPQLGIRLSPGDLLTVSVGILAALAAWRGTSKTA
jgi:hypothetical protein